MEYGVIITRTTGANIEETFFADLKEATDHYEHVINTTPYERVLILLLEKSASGQEDLIDVYFKDGISYSTLKVPSETHAYPSVRSQTTDRTANPGISSDQPQA